MVKDVILKEILKRGYSIANGKRSWDISDSKLWYLTPELSEGFLSLEGYFPYKMKVIDTEFDLIKNYSEKIANSVGNESFNLIDLGCGNGKKASAFIKSLPKEIKFRYCPVDVSEYFLNKAKEEVLKNHNDRDVEIKPILSDFKDFENVIGMVRNSKYQRNIVLLLGETVSHYEVNELLYRLSNPMWKGDVIFIGNGYRVGDRFVDLSKYNDPIFKNWFIEIMKEIGFNEEDVGYGARFENDRLEFCFKVKNGKNIMHDGYSIKFNEGDEFIVGCQYKYYESEWLEFFKMYFSDVEQIKDLDKEYAVYICKK